MFLLTALRAAGGIRDTAAPAVMEDLADKRAWEATKAVVTAPYAQMSGRSEAAMEATGRLWVTDQMVTRDTLERTEHPTRLNSSASA